MHYKIILGFYLNRVKNDQSGIGMIREDLSEVGWSDHVGGGCEAHKAPQGPLGSPITCRECIKKGQIDSL